MKKFTNSITRSWLLASVLFVIASCTPEPDNGATSDVETTEEKEKPQETHVAEVIDVAEFEQLAADSNAVVIDVRTPEEYNSGHIENAVNMNYHGDFKQQIKDLDTTKTYLLYCRSGGRSNAAMTAMNKAGFPRVYDLDGGITSWQEQGKPIK